MNTGSFTTSNSNSKESFFRSSLCLNKNYNLSSNSKGEKYRIKSNENKNITNDGKVEKIDNIINRESNNLLKLRSYYNEGFENIIINSEAYGKRLRSETKEVPTADKKPFYHQELANMEKKALLNTLITDHDLIFNYNKKANFIDAETQSYLYSKKKPVKNFNYNFNEAEKKHLATELNRNIEGIYQKGKNSKAEIPEFQINPTSRFSGDLVNESRKLKYKNDFVLKKYEDYKYQDFDEYEKNFLKNKYKETDKKITELSYCANQENNYYANHLFKRGYSETQKYNYDINKYHDIIISSQKNENKNLKNKSIQSKDNVRYSNDEEHKVKEEGNIKDINSEFKVKEIKEDKKSNDTGEEIMTLENKPDYNIPKEENLDMKIIDDSNKNDIIKLSNNEHQNPKVPAKGLNVRNIIINPNDLAISEEKLKLIKEKINKIKNFEIKDFSNSKNKNHNINNNLNINNNNKYEKTKEIEKIKQDNPLNPLNYLRSLTCRNSISTNQKFLSETKNFLKKRNNNNHLNPSSNTNASNNNNNNPNKNNNNTESIKNLITLNHKIPPTKENLFIKKLDTMSQSNAYNNKLVIQTDYASPSNKIQKKENNVNCTSHVYTNYNKNIDQGISNNKEINLAHSQNNNNNKLIEFSNKEILEVNDDKNQANHCKDNKDKDKDDIDFKLKKDYNKLLNNLKIDNILQKTKLIFSKQLGTSGMSTINHSNTKSKDNSRNKAYDFNKLKISENSPNLGIDAYKPGGFGVNQNISIKGYTKNDSEFNNQDLFSKFQNNKDNINNHNSNNHNRNSTIIINNNININTYIDNQNIYSRHKNNLNNNINNFNNYETNSELERKNYNKNKTQMNHNVGISYNKNSNNQKGIYEVISKNNKNSAYEKKNSNNINSLKSKEEDKSKDKQNVEKSGLRKSWDNGSNSESKEVNFRNKNINNFTLTSNENIIINNKVNKNKENSLAKNNNNSNSNNNYKNFLLCSYDNEIRTSDYTEIKTNKNNSKNNRNYDGKEELDNQCELMVKYSKKYDNRTLCADKASYYNEELRTDKIFVDFQNFNFYNKKQNGIYRDFDLGNNKMTSIKANNKLINAEEKLKANENLKTLGTKLAHKNPRRDLRSHSYFNSLDFDSMKSNFNIIDGNIYKYPSTRMTKMNYY